MRSIIVGVRVRGSRGEATIRALIDTGSTFIVLEPDTIKELGLLETPYTVELTLADGRKVKSRIYLAEVEARGRKGPVLIAELDTPIPILGVYALETLGFKVNPKTGELEEISPEGGYLLQLQYI